MCPTPLLALSWLSLCCLATVLSRNLGVILDNSLALTLPTKPAAQLCPLYLRSGPLVIHSSPPPDHVPCPRFHHGFPGHYTGFSQASCFYTCSSHPPLPFSITTARQAFKNTNLIMSPDACLEPLRIKIKNFHKPRRPCIVVPLPQPHRALIRALPSVPGIFSAPLSHDSSYSYSSFSFQFSGHFLGEPFLTSLNRAEHSVSGSPSTMYP